MAQAKVLTYEEGLCGRIEVQRKIALKACVDYGAKSDRFRHEQDKFFGLIREYTEVFEATIRGMQGGTPGQ